MLEAERKRRKKEDKKSGITQGEGEEDSEGDESMALMALDDILNRYQVAVPQEDILSRPMGEISHAEATEEVGDALLDMM